MSSFDMEIGAVSPAAPVIGNDNSVDASTIRRLVIVAFVSALALAGTLIGFSLEEQGKWPFSDNSPSVRIVID